MSGHSLDRHDDALLAVRAGEGDEDAFEVLVRRHGPVLLRLAEQLLGGPAEAEDAVQEALVSAWRRLPEFRGEAAFGSWMYLRARRPLTPLEAVAEPAAPEPQASPERAAETGAAVHALRDALGGLSPEQRACWVLREFHDLSYEDIARAVGISPQAVRGRIFRARRALTEAMAAWR
ncbi:RNA polymerase sigma factor [Streptomyces harbinensis]|uniref:RNA polymerase sigma factor n=1 Tax=Streptomyces harbinensis TaxID=1176198 RepID=UPI0034DE9826